ncbi:MAG: AAA family ATPase [Gammaproteobacteria bacterium]|jgi:chromosome partitioning protein
MHRIVVLNPKGGSGKTTVATNIAAYFAAMGARPMLVDMDPQRSSLRWSSHRPGDRPPIDCIEGFKPSSLVTRSWQMRPKPGCNVIVVDTPAAIEATRFPEVTRGADSILVPVMPSDIDIHATAKCIADLLLVAKIRRSENRIGIIANRVRLRTRVSLALQKFLDTLDIPLLATLRDTQNYVRSAQLGVGIFEMAERDTDRDKESWQSLVQWLEAKTVSAAH